MVNAIAALLLAVGGTLASPEVHADRTVTFRFRDVGASLVKLELEGYNAFDMKKGADSVWTYTTPPLPPIYTATASTSMARSAPIRTTARQSPT